jgi:serine phosphatase RsbU (regulator of sigma subunit)
MFGAFARSITRRRRDAARKDLLATASAAFDASLDPVQTMRTIANTSVPRLADLCVIDLLREDGMVGDSVVAALDPRVTHRLEQLRALHPLDSSGMHPVARALRTTEPIVVHDLTDPATLAAVSQSEEHRHFMQEVGYGSAVVIKLTARGRLLGTLSFLHMNGGGHFDSDDLGVMQDLASRAAMALDNANLYAERAHVARTLQRSLLPEALPRVQGVQLACAYRPVAEGGMVGGDFYDVFEDSGGCWLVVGDVCGKGTEAAALTALVRHSIRALALQRLGPAEVLSRTNAAMLSHDLGGRFATAILARLERSGDRTRVLLASAGHPPAIVVEPDGEAWPVETHGTLLGVLPEPRSSELEVSLRAGASLILYTDGLTDAGAPAHELQVEDLCAHLRGQAGSSPQTLVARLEELATSQGAPHLRDDIAILAARIDP